MKKSWIIRKDEERVPVDFAGDRVEFGGEMIIQGIFRDLTEPRKAETYRSMS